MTVALAPRCDALLAADLSARALALTDTRLREAGQRGHVTLERHRLPRDWPAPSFDLILLSEIAYYLDADELATLAAQSVATLAPAGTLMLCHWRAPFQDRRLTTEQVHAAFDASPRLHRLLRHEEDDFLLEAWSNEAWSVAQREGLA
jgi:chemotaxis methyl-accepting protein methylase